MENTIKHLKIRALYFLVQSLKSIAPQTAGLLSSALWFTPALRKPMPQYVELSQLSKNFVIEKILVRSWGPEDACSTVVLVHGWGGRWDQFADMIVCLSQAGHRVITFDLPGHGETFGFSTSIPEWMPFFSKLAEAIKTRAFYITHSFGFMAVSYAIRYHNLPAAGVIAINSPTSFQFLLEQYTQKLKLDIKTMKALLQNIKLRVGSDVEERVSVPIRKLKEQVPLYMLADEHDKEVPYSKSEECRAILKDDFLTTQNLGHSRILQSSYVHDCILQILSNSIHHHDTPPQIASSRIEHCHNRKQSRKAVTSHKP